MKRVFQFVDPRFSKTAVDDTRWIAASNEASARAEAERRGWKAGDEVLIGHSYSTDSDLVVAGCDVVLP